MTQIVTYQHTVYTNSSNTQSSSAAAAAHFLLTSVLMASGLFPSLPRKCSGDSMVPSWRKSASLSWSVSVVAEMPASGPRQGREPAASEGSGICPGIMSDPATTAATGGRGKEELAT